MDSPEACFKNAAQAFDVGNFEEAQRLLAPLLATYPNHPDVSHLSGAIALALNRPADAERALRHALAAATKDRRAEIRPALLNLLGSALRRLGRIGDAFPALEEAVALQPTLVDARFNLGNALLEAYRYPEAAKQYAEVVRLDPDAIDAWFGLGVIRLAYGDSGAAISYLEEVLRRNPRHVKALTCLSAARFERKEYRAATAAARQAIALDPKDWISHSNLGTTLLHLGHTDEAVSEVRQAMALAPSNAELHSKLVQHLHYAESDAAILLAEARGWNERHARPLSRHIRRHSNAPDAERRLRIGYVSGDFRRHPAGYLVAPLLENHDKEAVEVVCYATTLMEDDLTDRHRAKADVWRNVAGLKDESFAEVIRSDGIDILIDLAGHTEGHRLLAFAERPAPVQASAVGGCGTTGLAAMDYLIGDKFQTPPELERFYSENVLRLPDCWICYAPAITAPPVTSPPALRQGHITFGSFNNLGKITSQTLELWGRVLAAVPDAQLLMKGWALDEGDDRTAFLARATAAAIPTERLIIERGSDYRQYLRDYGRVDIGLDPTPYSGGLTTLDALWMGVPVVALPGQSFSSRYSTSYLSNMGLAELAAKTAEDYVAIAVRLATDRDRLATMRAGQRERMATSPLCDGPRYARNMESLYREMWRAWCDGRRNPLDLA